MSACGLYSWFSPEEDWSFSALVPSEEEEYPNQAPKAEPMEPRRMLDDVERPAAPGEERE
jgi:hypothetical protein